MKFICSKSSLSAALQIVSKAVSSKTTMSILECVMIDATEDFIRFIANDMEMGIQTDIAGNIIENGYVALDAKIFFEIIRKLPDADVTVEADINGIVTISCEKSRFNIPGRPGDDFTYLPEIQKIDGITLSQYTLKNLITRTIFSISENDPNKIMGGELFDIDGETLRVVALDGHRISIRKAALNSSYPARKVIVPGKTLNEVSRIISDSTEEEVSVFFTDKHILFSFAHTLVVSRLIEGEYFNVNQMLSNDYETKVTVNRKELVSSIDRATLLVKEGDKKPVIITIGDTALQLKINSTMGSMNEELDIEKKGKDIMIGFNPKFMIDALRVIEDETVDLYFVNPKAPCFIKDTADTYVYLVLPVNFTTVD